MRGLGLGLGFHSTPDEGCNAQLCPSQYTEGRDLTVPDALTFQFEETINQKLHRKMPTVSV